MNSFGTEKYRRWTTEQKRRILKEYEQVRNKEIREGTRGGIERLLFKYNITGAHLRQWRRHVIRADERSARA